MTTGVSHLEDKRETTHQVHRVFTDIKNLLVALVGAVDAQESDTSLLSIEFIDRASSGGSGSMVAELPQAS